MPTPVMGDIPILNNLKNASLEDLRDHLGKLQDYLIQQQRDQTYLLSTLDFENIFAVGGWRVNPDRIQSKDADVGMSTEDTGADDIRFWAGDAITGAPKFYVTKSGKMYAIDGTFVGTITADSGTIGGWIISAAGLSSGVSYPRIELKSTGNLLTAYHDSNNYFAVNPGDSFTPDPLLYFFSGGTVATISNNSSFSIFSIGADHSIALSSISDNIFLTAPGGSIFASSSGGTVFDVPSEIINAQADASSALSGLAGKVNTGSSTSSESVSDGHNHGFSTSDFIQCYDAVGAPTMKKQWVPYGGSASHSHTV